MLTTSVERLEGNNAKLTVTVSADQVDAAVAGAYKKISATLRIPGFRKGKVPRPVIDTHVGREQVLIEATEELVDSKYREAIIDEDLRTITSPEISVEEPVVEGEAFTFVARLQLRPELALSGYDDITVTVPPAEVSDVEVEAGLDQLRDRVASLEPVENRGIEAYDFAIISFTGYMDGEPYEGNVVDKSLYELGRGMMPVEFDQGLLGLKAGDETVVEFLMSAESGNAELAGKTARFEITVNEVKIKRLPELNDELAANFGFDDMDEMRADLRASLQESTSKSHALAKEKAAREELARRLEGDIPAVLPESRTQNMLQSFMKRLEDEGLSLDVYCDAYGIKPEEILGDIRKDAEENVREDLALESLFRALGLIVTQEDVDATYAELAEGMGTTVDEQRARWGQAQLPVLWEMVMHRKATAWLLENVKTVIAEPGAENATVAGAKKTTKKKTTKKAVEPAEETAEAAVEAPAEPVKKTTRKKAKPAEPTAE